MQKSSNLGDTSVKKRIIIADDHAVVRMGMQLILDETNDLGICDEACNGQELMHKLANNHFDLLIMDASMPGRDGLDLLREIKGAFPKLPVMVFTMNNDDNYAIRMIKAGAAAYVLKETQSAEIIQIIRIVITGKRYFSPLQLDLLANLVNEPAKYVKMPHEELTDREFQILLLLASGQKTHDIANKLMVSKHTVANHRSTLLRKMGMRGNAELARYAVMQGIIK
jgi:two-component system, NarL family, invasion response regulator UvrY